MTTVAPPDQALAGLRLLDLTTELGVLATRFLAGLGADVIRLEPPGGDPLRRRGPFYHEEPNPARSLSWFQMNAGKRGVTLNPGTADGRALLLRLVERSDALIESQTVGTLAAWGLDFATLTAANPRLVLTSISPYGQTGPLASAPGCDLSGVASGGLMFLCGDLDRPPLRVSVEQGYAQAGLHAAVATLVALAGRDQTGRGTHVDVSMQEAVSWTLGNNRLLWPGDGVISRRAGGGRSHGDAGSRLVFAAADGYFAFQRRPEGHNALAAWLDDNGLACPVDIRAWQDRPAYGPDAPPEREVAAVNEVLAAAFASRCKRDLCRDFQARGLIASEVMAPADLLDSDHLRERGFFQAIEHPELGERLTYPGAPFKLPLTPWQVSGRAPLLGEHNVAVYCDELGLGRAELALLRATGAI